jgi:hypothetical protein
MALGHPHRSTIEAVGEVGRTTKVKNLQPRRRALIDHGQSCEVTFHGSINRKEPSKQSKNYGEKKLTVLHNILAGDLKWKGPLLGFVLVLLVKN